MSYKAIFEGRHITKWHFSGAIRYEIEILKEFDHLAKKGEYAIMMNPECVDKINLQNIAVIPYRSKDKITKAIEILRLCNKHDCFYISFCNSISIGKKSINTWHDIYTFYNVSGKPLAGKIRINLFILQSFLCSKHIVTVSEYSKKTMLDKLPVNENKISVIPNGWQHIRSIKADESVLIQNNLEDKGYYFFIGRLVKNKNIDWIFKEADHNPSDTFVISGKLQKEEKFSSYYGKHNNIIYTGFITDEQMAALYIHCKAFLFPSLMEGFGIPPMEALYYGAPIIIANTSSLPEVYEDAAHYIDPYKYDYDLDEILKEPVADPQKILDKYSWEKSARQWYELIESI